MIATGPVDLTEEQKTVLQELLNRQTTCQVQTLGGFAGTGKTTLIARLIRELDDWAVCAFTGKAAHVLRRKGVPATTIHSRIYEPVGDGDDVDWQLKDDPGCRGFIVDEASMVSEALHNDLLSFDRPLIYVGDHGQLPPVAEGNFNLIEAPDLTLETIHRNAGEIARFAEHLRRGGEPGEWKKQRRGREGKVNFPQVNRALSNLTKTLAYDQIICALNRTRQTVNAQVRAGLGRTDDEPAPGDRIICLRNDRSLGLYNGLQGVITESCPAQRWLAFRAGEAGSASEERCSFKVRYLREGFQGVKPERVPRGWGLFDWAWAVTCHKAQGDEWPNVLVLEEQCPWAWERARWAYTAASRAEEHLDWVEL